MYENNPYAYTQAMRQNELNNLTKLRDEIDGRIASFQQIPVQPPAVQQTIVQTGHQASDFDGKFISSYDEAKSAIVSKPTIFMLTTDQLFFIKQGDGTIKCFKFEETDEPKDEKDKKIDTLIEENERLKDDIKEIKMMLKEANENGKQSDASINVAKRTKHNGE